MNELTQNFNVESVIYEIDGKEIMLDTDLAKLYQVETKRINEAVKNNPEKFPERFSFVLNRELINSLRSKFSTLEIKGQGQYSKYPPRAFTEQGVYMLATILKSKVATVVSLAIMDAFVKMRHYINYNKELLPNRVLLLEDKVDKNTERINELFDKFDPRDIAKHHIFYRGDYYDAYSLLLDIFEASYNEVIIVDNHASKELFDILRDINREFVVVSNNISNELKSKYEKQYNNITFININEMHDRFIILDRKRLFTCGASFKDLGKQGFSISEIEDKCILNSLLAILFDKK